MEFYCLLFQKKQVALIGLSLMRQNFVYLIVVSPGSGRRHRGRWFFIITAASLSCLVILR